MGSSWSLLTLFLVYSYPNERLGLLSATSRLGIRYAYRTPILRLCYAKLSCNFGYSYDIPWIYQQYSYDRPAHFLFYYKSLVPSFPLPTTLLRPSNDLATKSGKIEIRFADFSCNFSGLRLEQVDGLNFLFSVKLHQELFLQNQNGCDQS